MRRFFGFQRGTRRTPGRRRVLFFGTYDAAVYPRIAVLREGFAALGDDIVECNVPLRVPTSLRVRMLRRPWLAPLLVLQILRAWASLVVRARSVGPVDVIVVGYMGQFDVHLARLLWPTVPIVLDHLVPAAEAAVDRRCKNTVIVWALRLLDWAATRTADIVCVDTKEHLALAGRRGGVVVPVGAPERWFAPPRQTSAGPLKVIFFGSFTPLQGAPVIAEAMSLLRGTGIQFTIVGRGQDWEASHEIARDCENVRWIDWVDADRLAALVAEHDVTLGIFGTGTKARAVVPTKVFQGAAAGTALVTSDTPPQRTTLGDAAAYVPPGDAEALTRTLLALANDRQRVERLRHAAFRIANTQFRPGAVVMPLAAPRPVATRDALARDLARVA